MRHVVIRGESYDPCLGEDLKPLMKRLSSVTLIMIVGTMRLVALLSMLARIKLIVLRMILLLFPTVTLQASVLVWTAIFVVIDKLTRAPIRTLIFMVVVKLRLSPEVLPVVRKDTLVSLVIVLVVGAPNSLEVKHVEV